MTHSTPGHEFVLINAFTEQIYVSGVYSKVGKKARHLGERSDGQ